MRIFHSTPGFSVLLIFTYALRLGFIFWGARVDHDPAISYLAATGNQQHWADWLDGYTSTAYGVIAAEEIRSFFFPANTAFNPLKISHTLYNTDVHPPLYFIVLNVWLALFGSSSFPVGLALNLVFDTISWLVLYWFVRQATGSLFTAQVTALFWLFNSAVLAASLYVRQYSLLACCAIILVAGYYQWMHPDIGNRHWKWASVVLISTIAGMLTHYWFVIPAMVLGMYGLVRAVGYPQLRPRVVLYALSGVVSAGIWFALGIQHQLAAVADSTQFDRLRIFFSGLTGLSSFFFDTQGYTVLSTRTVSDLIGIEPLTTSAIHSIAAGIIILAIAGLTIIAFQSKTRAFLGQHRAFVVYLVVVSIVPYSIIIAISLSGLINRSGLGSVYLAFIWPFLSILVVMILTPYHRLAWLVLSLVIISSSLGVMIDTANTQLSSRHLGQFQNAELVLVNTTARGHVGRMSYYLQDQQEVLLYDQQSWAEAYQIVQQSGKELVILVEFSTGPSHAELDLPAGYTWQPLPRLSPVEGGFWTLVPASR